MEQVVSKLILERKIKPIIVVGIDSGTNRSHEYWPYPSVFELPNEQPIGRSMPEFLINEVIPSLRAYPITSNPAWTGIGGISNGALAVLYTALTRPDRFGLVLLESPPLYDGNGQLVKDAANLARGRPDIDWHWHQRDWAA